MARRLTTNGQIDSYIASVITEANHHAPQVEHVIQPLASAVRARLGPNDTIDVYERNGVVARTCWVRIAGARYCFSYDYTNHVIDLRERSLQGNLRFAFDNGTAAAQIRAQVAAL
ncbi:Integron cassette protein [compost metagenome]